MRVRFLVAVFALVVVPVFVGARQGTEPPQTQKTRVTETVYEPGQGVSCPQVVKESKPEYPKDVQQVNGTVELEVVVGGDGKVTSAFVTKSLDKGGPYDKSAIESAKKWEFKPGVKDGKPVPTKVSLVLEYRKKV